MGRRRRRGGGFFRRAFRSVGRLVRGVGKSIGKVNKGIFGIAKKLVRVVTAPISAVANLAKRLTGRGGKSKGKGGYWGASIGNKKGGGFVSVDGPGDIIITINPQPAEMGDKVDIDWDTTEHTKDKMFNLHVHRLAGPIPEPARGKERKG